MKKAMFLDICYLDLDGVLVDLHKVIYEKFKVDCVADQTLWNNGELGLPDEVVWAGTDAEWWAELPWTQNGREILAACEECFGKENVVICTKPARWTGSVEGKVQWLERHLPDYARQYIMTPSKWWIAHHYGLLVDDSDENVKKFRDNGGHAVLVPRPWNDARIETRSFPALLEESVRSIEWHMVASDSF